MGNPHKRSPRRAKGRRSPMDDAVFFRLCAVLGSVEQSAKGRRLLRDGDALVARVEKNPTVMGAADLLLDAVSFYLEAMNHQRHLKHGLKKFPPLLARPVLPSDGLCPRCKKRQVMGGRSTVIVMGGAMRVVDAKTRSAEIAEDCIGFLDLHWHDGEGENAVDVYLPIAADTPGGQFEFYFCSIYCLELFFSACVEELQVRLEEERIKRARKARRGGGAS